MWDTVIFCKCVYFGMMWSLLSYTVTDSYLDVCSFGISGLWVGSLPMYCVSVLLKLCFSVCIIVCSDSCSGAALDYCIVAVVVLLVCEMRLNLVLNFFQCCLWNKVIVQ